MPATRHCRVLIIGSGPAGYTAAIYAARANLQPVLVQGLEVGGQLSITTDVENYPGFAEVIQGPWLMEQMAAQAAHCGARAGVRQHRRGRPRPPAVRRHGRFRRRLSLADALILATGAQARWLGLPSETAVPPVRRVGLRDLRRLLLPRQAGRGGRRRQHRGRGGALSEPDGEQRDPDPPPRPAARREGPAGPPVRATPRSRCSGTAWSRRSWARISRPRSPACGCATRASGALSELAVDGVFIAIGHDPATQLVRGQLEMDADGYVITAPDSTRDQRAGRVRRRRRAGQDLPPGGDRGRHRLHGGARGGEVPGRGTSRRARRPAALRRDEAEEPEP